MANGGFPPYIFADPVAARQMENWTNNAARADLMKQESMLRIAELGLRKQQQQETAELNKLLTQSQLDQRRLDNEFRDRQLSQQLEIAKMPSIREAEFNKKIQLEEEDRKRLEEEEVRIITDTERALDELNKRERAVTELKRFGDQGRKDINVPKLQGMLLEIKTQRDGIIEGMARSGYQYDPTTGKFIGVKRRAPVAPIGTGIPPTGFTAPPSASAINAPPVVSDPRVDALKRQAAAAIQRGANPAAVYQRLAELGIELR